MTQPIDPLRLEKAQSGDEAALATLIARFMPTIRSLAKRAESPGLDFDDAVQEGYIGLFHAVKTYDPAKGTAFATYATTCIRNSIVTAMRAAGRKKHAPLNSSVPLRESATVPGPEELAILKEQYREAVRGKMCIRDRSSSAEIWQPIGQPIQVSSFLLLIPARLLPAAIPPEQ